jgi:hypothetical protein
VNLLVYLEGTLQFHHLGEYFVRQLQVHLHGSKSLPAVLRRSRQMLLVLARSVEVILAEITLWMSQLELLTHLPEQDC